MRAVIIERILSDPKTRMRWLEFATFAEMDEFLFREAKGPGGLSFPSTDESRSCAPLYTAIWLDAGGSHMSIPLILNDDRGVLFSTGTLEGYRPHVSAEVKEWLVKVKEREIPEKKIQYVP